MKVFHAVCFLLVISLSLYLLHLPLVNAAELAWGTPLNISQSISVGQDVEIPKGEWAYVFNKATGPKTVSADDWNKMMSGDLSQVASQIENGIHGTKATWIRISWTSVSYNAQARNYYVVGFMIEAIVENVNAGQTGAEIVLILMAVAFFIALVVLIALAAWVTVQIISATQQLGPVATIIVGILILGGIAFLLYTMLGGKVKYSGKGRRISTGKD